MTRLFVYGTLKRGCKNHAQLAGQIYLGEARTATGYRLYDLGDYPGMVSDATDTEGVTGEIWSVDDTALARLDAFEGVDVGIYLRTPVELAEQPFPDSAANADAANALTEVHTYLYAGNVSDRPRLGPSWVEV